MYNIGTTALYGEVGYEQIAQTQTGPSIEYISALTSSFENMFFDFASE
jgi:hypothetical protein